MLLQPLEDLFKPRKIHMVDATRQCLHLVVLDIGDEQAECRHTRSIRDQHPRDIEILRQRASMDRSGAPNGSNVNCRGSKPRCTETRRTSSFMRALMMRWIPAPVSMIKSDAGRRRA